MKRPTPIESPVRTLFARLASLHGGVPAPPPSSVAAWSGAVVASYVGGRSLEKIAKTIWSGK